MGPILDYSYIALTISPTPYGQVILRARSAGHDALRKDFDAKLRFWLHLVPDLLFFASFVAGFLACILSMAGTTKFDITALALFMNLNFVIVLILGGWLLNQQSPCRNWQVCR